MTVRKSAREGRVLCGSSHDGWQRNDQGASGHRAICMQRMGFFGLIRFPLQSGTHLEDYPGSAPPGAC